MALPAMIQGYAQDQSQRFSALSQSLAQLGQQVGQQLANREYQRQAQAELPYMQEAMNRAIDRVQANDIAQGYREMMTAIPWNSTNPYLQQTAQGMMGAFERAAEYQNKLEQRKAQYGGGGTVGVGMSGADVAMSQLGLPVMGGQPMQNQPPLQALPVDGEPLPTGDTGAEPPNLTEGAADIPPTPEGVGQPDQTQIEAANVAAQATDATPARYDKAVEGTTISKSDDTSNWQSTEIVGLSKLFPKINLSDEIKIAPVGTKTEYSQTWSGETKKEGARFSGTKSIKIDEDLNKKANEYASALQESVSLIDGTGPEDSDKTWSEIIQEAGGMGNVIPATAGQNEYSVRVKGKETYNINEGTFEAFQRVKGFPAFASRTGIKAMPKEKGKPIQPKPTPTPIPNRPPLGSFFGIK